MRKEGNVDERTHANVGEILLNKVGQNHANQIESVQPAFSSDNFGRSTYTVGTSGTYDIAAAGAQGGSSGFSGGAGAAVSGDVYLQAGTKLDIIVGGEGGAGSAGGGGGGSFVIEENGSTFAQDTILAVAGGGGGAYEGGGLLGYGVAGGSGGNTVTGGNGGGKFGGLGGKHGAPGQGADAFGGGGGGFTGGRGSGSLVSPESGSVAGISFAGGIGSGATTGNGGGSGGYGGGGGGSTEVADSYGGGGGGGSYLDSSLTNGVETAGVHDGDGLVTIESVVCYVSGTRILTDRGEVAVENLRIGDMLMTASGAHRPVRWLGSRRVDCARHPEPLTVWPVRIQAGAFAPGVPARALWVSPGHSIFVEGVLIQAEKLVNGATITQMPLHSVEYWHVELDGHDVILAEGLSAESYLDTGNRAAFFHNGGAYLQAHPDFRPKRWAETCVPLIFEGAALQKARGDLRERAIALGFNLTEDPDVHAVVDGERVDPVRLGAERIAFLLPKEGSTIELRSRTFIPAAHVDASSGDSRSLGIDVYRLQIDVEVSLDDENQFTCGWHQLEQRENGEHCRWSRDRVPLPAGTRLVVIDMHVRNALYWLEPAATVKASHGSDAVLRA